MTDLMLAEMMIAFDVEPTAGSTVFGGPEYSSKSAVRHGSSLAEW